jgi:hypothetical protein
MVSFLLGQVFNYLTDCFSKYRKAEFPKLVPPTAILLASARLLTASVNFRREGPNEALGRGIAAGTGWQ